MHCLALYECYLVDMNLFVRISNQLQFQKIGGWALLRGVDAYSRGALIGYYVIGID